METDELLNSGLRKLMIARIEAFSWMKTESGAVEAVFALEALWPTRDYLREYIGY